MSADKRCRDCGRPIRMVSIGTWDGSWIPVDYRPVVAGGEYAIVGGTTAAYIHAADREKFSGQLYADHRRTCTGQKESSEILTSVAKVRIACGACQRAKSWWCDAAEARAEVEKFLEEHTNCRGGLARKAS